MPPLTPRRRKRVKNRLAKHGLDFVRFEQDDPHLLRVRVILVKQPENLGRAFTYPRIFVKTSGPRVIADAILSDYAKGYGAK